MTRKSCIPDKSPYFVSLLFFIFFSLSASSALAWDSVGHRISAAIALEFLSTETRDDLLALLAFHPRYNEDFLEQIPNFVDHEDKSELGRWLLGQAAYWPDIARGLPEPERAKYNRPNWHYTDGAWIRGSALLQGNLYLNITPFPDRQGEGHNNIESEHDVHNVVTAIDYSTQVLKDTSRSAAERAVALCWVLHLIGDIHQPMHTGSLYSANTFEDGDLGGNRIPVTIESSLMPDSSQSIRTLNLHAAWDGALRDIGIAESVPAIVQQITGFTQPSIANVESDWTAWMNESRQLLQNQVYSQQILNAALAADSRRSGEITTPVHLDSDYVQRMQAIARQRLGLAGLRLAIWFENELP